MNLRRLKLEDLDQYRYWKLPQHKYHSLNGPYFKKDSVEEVDAYIQCLKKDLANNKSVLENKRIIANDEGKIIGEVSWYWRSQETNWLEIGIVIFDEAFWGMGIGYSALKLWIEEVFNQKEEIVRIGLSTWAGNHGMIKLAKKLGLKEEARYRNARIVNGEYFDSVSYGILKTEWKSN